MHAPDFVSWMCRSEEEAKALGPQMVFVTLRGENEREELADVASRWKEVRELKAIGPVSIAIARFFLWC